jgi:hypothetical protein
MAEVTLQLPATCPRCCCCPTPVCKRQQGQTGRVAAGEGTLAFAPVQLGASSLDGQGSGARGCNRRHGGGVQRKALKARCAPRWWTRLVRQGAAMISLAGRDILHSWGKYVLTGLGLGLLIGVTLTMAGVYRGMVDDAQALLANSGADLWVVQKTPRARTPNPPASRTTWCAACVACPAWARRPTSPTSRMQVQKVGGRRKHVPWWWASSRGPAR